MRDKIKKLQRHGISLATIEKGAGLSRGWLSKALKANKFTKYTENKVTAYYYKVVKDFVKDLL